MVQFARLPLQSTFYETLYLQHLSMITAKTVMTEMGNTNLECLKKEK